MSRTGLIVLAAGGLALVALVTWFGAREIGAQLWRAAWAVPPCVALHAVQLWLSALAWRGLGGGAAAPWLRIRWMREAVNSMLPVAQIGGNLAGIRLLGQHGLALPRASAATVLDLTAEALSQALFTLLGLATLAAIGHDPAWRPWLGGGVGAMLAGVAGFVLAQRAGLGRLIEALATRMSGFVPGLAPDALRGLQAELLRLHRDRAALARAVALHLLAWLLGVGETWLALFAMGSEAGLAAALAIESLGMAARSAGFVVPGALGVQEGGFVLACGLFGLPADAAIALSMVKRARELVVGVPGLIAWQWSEGRRLLRRA